MKSKIVIWGENSADEKVLLALELLERDNKVNIYLFPLAIATEAFYQELRDKWRLGEEVQFPEGYQTIVRELSVSESLLPEDLKVDRPDVITRAQSEWHFIVLSTKMYELYKGELDEIKDRIDRLTAYEDSYWNEMVAFWNKVQEQVSSKHLFREQAATLKERTNILFDKLKALKKDLEKQLEAQSSEMVKTFHDRIAAVSEKIEQGISFKPLFEDLKKIQTELFASKIMRRDRDKAKDALDKAFESLKSRRENGSEPRKNNDQRGEGGRLQSRLTGLLQALRKMEESLQRDKNDMTFEDKKIRETNGQLELQIRQAKLNIIKDRITSKQAKIEDMMKLKNELESKMEAEQRKSEERARAAKTKEKAEEIKQKISEEIKSNEAERGEMAEKLQAAAEEIASTKKAKESAPKEGFLAAAAATLGDSIGDMVDTVRAVAEVVEDKLEDAADKIEDKFEDVVDVVKDKFEDVKDAVEDKIDEVKKRMKNSEEE